MSTPSLTRKSFELLSGLEANNSREWFTPRKQEFREFLQDPFAEILEAASSKLKNAKLPVSGGKKTMFRLYRDVRFAKDKRPFNTHVSGLLTPSGEKNESNALVYANVDSSGGFLAAGFYLLPTALLNRIRDRIIEEPETFRKIVRKLLRDGYEFGTDNVLKTMPRGYSEHATHEHVDFLRMKCLILRQSQPKKAWLEGSIVQQIVQMAKKTADFNLFGMEAMSVE